MSDDSKIEWTDATWQVTRGCSQVSAGCTNCYAQAFAHRGLHESTRGLTRATESGPRWTGEIRLAPENLDQPLKWKHPRRIFVNSMSDLFHEDVPDEYIAAVFGVMASCPQHTFQVLTKRAERMTRWFESAAHRALDWCACAADDALESYLPRSDRALAFAPGRGSKTWPLPNVWMGVSVENQEQADKRIPHLLRTPSAVRFLSCEPLLERVDLNCIDATRAGWRAVNGFPEPTEISAFGKRQADGAKLQDGVDWVIVGGESGPGARPLDLGWARSIVGQCRAAGVACFVKQLGANAVPGRIPFPSAGADAYTLEALGLRNKKGGEMSECPADLRVREFPRGAR